MGKYWVRCLSHTGSGACITSMMMMGIDPCKANVVKEWMDIHRYWAQVRGDVEAHDNGNYYNGTKLPNSTTY
jgi:hypothetical protein